MPYLEQMRSLGRVDLCCMNFVQIQSVLIATTDYRPSGISQNPATKSKTLWVEPFGSVTDVKRLCSISAASSLTHVE